MSGKIWIDVGDLMEHISYGRRPSGIQRLEFELCKALAEFAPAQGRVSFITYDSVDGLFRMLNWAELSHSYDDVANRDAAPNGMAISGSPVGEPPKRGENVRIFLKRAVSSLPPGLRYPLINFGAYQLKAIRSFLTIWWNIGLGVVAPVRSRLKRLKLDKNANEATLHQKSPAWDPKPGDVLVSFGATWRPEYPARVEAARRQYGLRFAMLFHDIIPLRRPEWVDPDLVKVFTPWVRGTLPLTDVIFANSKATASDVAQYAGQMGLDVNGKIHTLPIGTGFSQSDRGDQKEQAPKRPLPLPGSYVLVVSTIEPRKNHSLPFRVWRHLLEDLPRDRVPALVFAGGVGWLTSDFMQQMKNANYLDGKVILVEKPSDAELEALYAGCQYTIYPSYYEGWGLPVTESHAYRRPCLASNRTSIPEAGGSLARYFDPDNAHELYGHVRSLIEKPEDLKGWQARVAADFKPTPWEDSARTIVRVLRGEEELMSESSHYADTVRSASGS